MQRQKWRHWARHFKDRVTFPTTTTPFPLSSEPTTTKREKGVVAFGILGSPSSQHKHTQNTASSASHNAFPLPLEERCRPLRCTFALDQLQNLLFLPRRFDPVVAFGGRGRDRGRQDDPALEVNLGDHWNGRGRGRIDERLEQRLSAPLAGASAGSSVAAKVSRGLARYGSRRRRNITVRKVTVSRNSSLEK